jgi:AcrR family transcriptional regulator
MTKTTESKWRDLIADQARSGMTVLEFAARRGINPSTLYWWRSRLGQPAAADLVPVEIVDAYSGYDEVIRQNEIVAVGCWADARRRFYQAQDSESEAKHALDVIRCMYRVEQDARDRSLSPEQRRELRQSESKPLLNAMRPWLEGIRQRHLPKSPMGDAIGYALRQWETLVRYLDDGRLDIDNNRVERQMRSVAVGRKNWMFAGSAAGARRAATIYSLVNTCGLLGIEPWACLKDVLQRIAEGADAATLTPRLWKSAAAAASGS